MAAQRPNVIVYQEYENLTVTPDIPDLNILIVGPCNQILDYLDDKEDCYAEDYGTLNGNNPLVSASSVIIASPPNALPGIVLDESSVGVFFDAARAVIIADAAVTSEYAKYTSGDNLFYAHDADGGVDFIAKEVTAGDILITAGSGTSDHIKTVKTVVSTFIDTNTSVQFQTNGVQPGDIITIKNDVPPGGVSRNGTYTVYAVRDENTLEIVGTDWTQNPSASFTGAFTCDFVITTSTGALRMSGTGEEMANYADLYTTTDFSETAPASARWRIERDVLDVELDDTDYTISGNTITVAAAITIDLSDTLLAKEISYAKIYVEYTALRTDLQGEITTLSNYSEMETTLGKHDARNPLFVGAVVAKANTTTTVQVYGVKSNDLPGYLDFLDRISSERDVYAIAPLTYDTSVIAAINTMCENVADPNYVLTAGIKQKFRMTLGAVELQKSKYIVNATSGASSNTVAATAPSGNKTMTLSVGGLTPAIDLVTLGVVPGDIVRTTVAAGPTVTNYVVAHLNGALVLETDDAFITQALAADGDIIAILDSTGVTTKYTHTLDNSGDSDTVTLTASALDNLYLELQVAGANFITDGVVPGDYVEIPDTLTTNNFTSYGSWVVDNVLSEERLRVVNKGNNTSTVANELPHLYSREDATPITSGTMYFRIMREMDKTQQVTTMVEVATSFASKRLILCYPDLVDVAGLVDGSLTRSVDTVPEVAAPQPGYYLACAVGGQTAGNPPQQGFTNVGIAGITRIYNSSEYFAEEQITDLSNGGVYVFVQSNPNALPTSVHELTTDVSTLEFSEYMVVKDFDFIAWTYLDTLRPFIGPWNVIPETVEFIQQALITTGNTLKSRYVQRIGPPLVAYNLEAVDISDLSSDRIEAFVDVDLPMTLNTIGLHLVA